MGQSVRMSKYDKVWSYYTTDSWEQYRQLIETMLTLLPDEQLDDLLEHLEEQKRLSE